MLNTNLNQELKVIHKTLQDKMRLQAEAQQEAANAAILQRFFMELKQTAINKNGAGVLQNASNQFIYENIIKTACGRQNAARRAAGLSRLTKTFGVFQRSYGSAQTLSKFDDIFEEEMYFVMQAIEQAISKKMPKNIQATGQIQYSVLEQGINQGISEGIDQAVKQGAPRTQKKFQARQNKVTVQAQASRSGKSDIVVGNDTISYRLGASPYLIQIYTLLKDSGFSLKNYKSLTYSDIGLDIYGHPISALVPVAQKYISLGQTTYGKALVGAITSLGYSSDNAITTANRLINSKSENNKQHMFHLQFYYELTGAGLIGHAPVKYLIYNDPSTSNIYVKSAAQIVLDTLNKPGGGMNIAKSSFS